MKKLKYLEGFGAYSTINRYTVNPFTPNLKIKSSRSSSIQKDNENTKTINKYNIEDLYIPDIYSDEEKEKFSSYDFQKEFLNEYPEKYLELEPFGYASGIKEEFKWIFDAVNMGLM